MAINIKFDSEHNVIQPKVTLARRSGSRIANLPACNINLTKSFNSYAEISFDVHKYDNEIEYRYWDDIKDLRLVWVKDWNVFFEIQVQIDEADETVKHITGKSLGECELSQINLYDIEINTESDIERDDYVPTVLYNGEDANASLMNRIMAKAPHYSIGHVDNSIASMQRTFSFNDKSIYDSLNEISEEMNCIFVIDSSMRNNRPARIVSAYDLEPHCLSCGARGPFYTVNADDAVTGETSSPVNNRNIKCKKCGGSSISLGFGYNTPIYVSVENLADEVQYETDVDSVKNCFKLEAGDDLMTATVRSINPNGSSYIWYVSDELKDDMSDALVSKLNEYDEAYDHYINDYVPSIGASLLEDYNDLVDKYSPYNPDLKKYDSTKTGFSNLVQAFYDNIDFEAYLEDVFMPAPDMPGIGASVQAAKLTSKSIDTVAVSNLKTCSTYTATSSVVSVAKTIIDPGYTVKAETSQYADGKWTGILLVTNNSLADDTASTGMITVNVTDDYQAYIKQSIEKQLDNKSSEYADMITVFSYGDEVFALELQKYCAKELEVFHDSCQAVLDILIKQGASSIGTFYDNYYTKLGIIDAEIIARNSEIETITKMQDIIRSEFELIRGSLDFETYLGEDLWHEFIAFRREDTYSNSNFISDGLDNAGVVKRALEFMEVAKKDIYKSATLQHSITAKVNNLLTMDEFSPIVDYFEDGNWIHIKVDDNVYRLRLVEYDVSFENNDIEVKFSDVSSIGSSVSDLESVVSQMSSISSSYDAVVRQASIGSKSSEIVSSWIDSGLDTTAARIVNSADNQSQTWDSHGMLFKQNDPITGVDTGEQLRIVNSTIAITDDNWNSVKTAIGKFYYTDPKTNEYVQAYGINGEVLVGKLILGQELGIYSDSQTMKFNEDGLEITNGTNTFKVNPNDLANMFVLLNGDDEVLYTDASGNTTYKGKVVVDGDTVSVVIDPTAEEVFAIKTADSNIISVDSSGNATFKGAINSDSAKIGNDTQYISYEDGQLTIKADKVSIGGDDVTFSIANAKRDGSRYATNYLYYSPEKGLVVSGYAPSSDAEVETLDSYNSRVTSEGFDVYETGVDRVAHFGQVTVLGKEGQSRQIVDSESLSFTTKEGTTVFTVENSIAGSGYSIDEDIQLSSIGTYLNSDNTLNNEAVADIIASIANGKVMTSSQYDFVSSAYNTSFEAELFGYAFVEVEYQSGESADDDPQIETGDEDITSGIEQTQQFSSVLYLDHTIEYNDGTMTATSGEILGPNLDSFVDTFSNMFPTGSKNHELFLRFTLRYEMADVQMTVGSRKDDELIGSRSVSIGSDNVSSGVGSVAIGKNITVTDNYSVIVGEKNIPIKYLNTDTIIPTAFAVGTNGKTPFAVLKNGTVTMSSVNGGEVAQRTYKAYSLTNIRVDFEVEYPTPPFIFLTLNEDNVPNNKTDIIGYGSIQVYKKTVDTTGFTATVVNGSSKSHTFSFSWFAISTM